MESDQYKSIGDIFRSGSSVNGKDAFIKPLPLRKKGFGKENLSPQLRPSSIPLFAKKSLKDDKPSDKQESDPKLELRNQAIKKRIEEKQKKLQEQTTTKAGDKPSSTSSSSTTTRQSTSTRQNTSTQRGGTSMARRDRQQSSGNSGGGRGGPGNRKGDEPFVTSSHFQETTSPFNIKTSDADSTAYVVNGVGGSLEHEIILSSTCVLRPETLSSQISGGELTPKFLVNSTSFSSAIGDASTNNVKFYDTFLNLYFSRMTADVLRYTKGNPPSFWTQTNFRTAIQSAVQALEYYYTLDSILAFQNRSVGQLGGSRSLDIYSNIFNQAGILNARDNLRRYLISVWCPPELAQFIRGFFQYYRLSSRAGQCTIIRYVPHQDFIVNLATPSVVATNVNTTVAILYNNLQSSNTVSCLGLVSNIHQSGIINGVPKSADDAHFSENMLELFINEPTIFNDVNNTNAISSVPISYYDTVNDVPYFALQNPDKLNGTNFALQTLPTTATTINSGLAWATNTNYFGMRKPVIVGTAPSQGNKWIFDAASNTMVSRSISAPTNMVNGIDTHVALSILSSTIPMNFPPLGGQRVYYDQYVAPATNFNVLASKLFGTAV